jgi:hypothetical protein
MRSERLFYTRLLATVFSALKLSLVFSNYLLSRTHLGGTIPAAAGK